MMSDTPTIETILEGIFTRVVRRELEKFKPKSYGDYGPLYTAKQAAEILGVPKSWVEREARRGKLRVTKLGHYIRFRPADVDTFIEANKEPVVSTRVREIKNSTR